MDVADREALDTAMPANGKDKELPPLPTWRGESFWWTLPTETSFARRWTRNECSLSTPTFSSIRLTKTRKFTLPATSCLCSGGMTRPTYFSRGTSATSSCVFTTHPRYPRSPWSPGQAWQFLETLLSSPGFELLVATPRHAAALAQTLAEVSEARGNLIFDLHTAVLMREHGIRRICTRDRDFGRFPFLEVVDPLGV